MIINAGIETVVVRDTATSYRTIDVWESWVNQDAYRWNRSDISETAPRLWRGAVLFEQSV